MKKLISLILILCMACLLIPAVAEDTLTGEWFLKAMAMGDTQYDAAALGLSVSLTVNEDGTLSMIDPDGTASEGTWSADGDKIVMVMKDAETGEDAPADAVLADGLLTLSADGQTMIFSREAIETITVGNVKAAASAEEFYGDWTLLYGDMDGSIMRTAAVGVEMNVKLGEGTVEFYGGELAEMYNLFGLTSTFENGALTLASSLEMINATGTAELLDDGMIKFTLQPGESEATIFYFAPAE